MAWSTPSLIIGCMWCVFMTAVLSFLYVDVHVSNDNSNVED